MKMKTLFLSLLICFVAITSCSDARSQLKNDDAPPLPEAMPTYDDIVDPVTEQTIEADEAKQKDTVVLNYATTSNKKLKVFLFSYELHYKPRSNGFGGQRPPAFVGFPIQREALKLNLKSPVTGHLAAFVSLAGSQDYRYAGSFFVSGPKDPLLTITETKDQKNPFSATLTERIAKP